MVHVCRIGGAKAREKVQYIKDRFGRILQLEFANDEAYLQM